MNPFNWQGPDFLLLISIIWLVTFVAALVLRALLRQPRGEPAVELLNMDPYEIAYLAGGARRAINAAIASLIHRKVCSVDPETRDVVADAPLTGDAARLEKEVYHLASQQGGRRVARIPGDLRKSAAIQIIQSWLRERGLLVQTQTDLSARLICVGLGLVPPLGGAFKIGLNLWRDRPVGYLVLGTVMAALLALMVFARPLNRSGRGDRALRRLRRDNAALRYTVRRRLAQCTVTDVTLAVGLFGLGILANTAVADLHYLATIPRGGGGPGSCGSGCGGGGGCGGGCGGCGG
jgi:uncharacterized protein (TIGR04222 family)